MKGTGNPADLGTKHLTAKKIEELVHKISLVEAEGRADKSLSIG